MSGAIKLRDDYSGEELLRLAAMVRDGGQSRRLMALAAIYDGKNRTQAAAVGLMDGAGWHKAGDLNIPKNISIMFIPPYSPELNPVENI